MNMDYSQDILSPEANGSTMSDNNLQGGENYLKETVMDSHLYDLPDSQLLNRSIVKETVYSACLVLFPKCSLYGCKGGY